MLWDPNSGPQARAARLNQQSCLPAPSDLILAFCNCHSDRNQSGNLWLKGLFSLRFDIFFSKENMDVEIEQRGILKSVQAHGSGTERNQFAKIKKT